MPTSWIDPLLGSFKITFGTEDRLSRVEVSGRTQRSERSDALFFLDLRP